MMKCVEKSVAVTIQSLSELKCLFVEQKKHRDQVSVTTVQNYSKFDLFECKLISAIEFLFREIPVKLLFLK
jgi:hypothetical protein